METPSTSSRDDLITALFMSSLVLFATLYFSLL